MKVSVSTIAPAELDVDLLVVPVNLAGKAEIGAAIGLSGKLFDAALSDFSAKLGETAVFYPEKKFQSPRVCLAGLGDAEDVTVEALRRAAAAAEEKR